MEACNEICHSRQIPATFISSIPLVVTELVMHEAEDLCHYIRSISELGSGGAPFEKECVGFGGEHYREMTENSLEGHFVKGQVCRCPTHPITLLCA